ncbi:MAG: hydrolase [Proteobacteria bacterium]|nr:hydrolase [Pseudomonadota bacterium]
MANVFSPSKLIRREESMLVVIDVQEKLMPAIFNRQHVIDNVIRLLKFARIIGLPVILTEQDKLGPTLPEIKKEIPGVDPIIKTSFNCFYCPEFSERIKKPGRNTLILAGVENHVCVAQTAIHALPNFNVHVVSNAVSSRTPENWSVGIERMRQFGAVITSTEMLIFELLRKAGTEEFRATLPLVK